MDAVEIEILKQKIQRQPVDVKVASNSMEPILKTGDIVKIYPLTQPPRIFDVVVFKNNLQLNCHFVWRNQLDFNNTLVTRSLKEPGLDEVPINMTEILGWVPDAKISLIMKFRLILWNWLTNQL